MIAFLKAILGIAGNLTYCANFIFFYIGIVVLTCILPSLIKRLKSTIDLGHAFPDFIILIASSTSVALIGGMTPNIGTSCGKCEEQFLQ